jgi:DNA polymerase/3'-5' exonuclease PolX
MFFFTKKLHDRIAELESQLKGPNVDLENEMIAYALTATNISKIRGYIRAAETIRKLPYKVINSDDVPDIGKGVASKIDSYFYITRTNDSIADFLEGESLDEDADMIRKLPYEVTCGEDIPGIRATIAEMIDEFLHGN